MTGKTHFIVGTTAALLITQPQDAKSIALTIGFAGIAAMYPDIDSPTSIIHKKTKEVVSFFGTLIAILIAACMYSAYTIAPITQDPALFRLILGFGAGFVFTLIGSHCSYQGFTHSIFALIWVLLCVFIAGTPKDYLLCVLIGYTSHLILDLLNEMGEQLLFPLPFRFCLHLCKSDGFIDTMTQLSGYVIVSIYIVRLIPVETMQSITQVLQEMW